MMNPKYEVFKVSAKTSPNSVAGALAPIIRDAVAANPMIKQFAELSCIGAASVNQAVKAVAIASGMVAPNGIEIACKPAFSDIIVKDEEKTSVRLIIIRV